MSFYTTIDDIRRRGLPEPSPTDSEIEHAMSISMEIIDSWCGQDFFEHNDVEITVDGNGGDRIIFGKRIRSISSLEINDSVIPSDSIVHSPDSSMGEVALKDGYKFWSGVGNVKLVANIGWSSVPNAVQEACAHLSSMILNRQLFGGRPEIAEMQTERLLDYTRSRFSPSEIKGIIEQDPYLFGLLRPYRLKGVLD